MKEYDGVRFLPTALLAPSPANPRKVFDVKRLEDLAASLRETGVVEPLIVRPERTLGALGEPRYEIIAGERRWRAAQLAGLGTLPCIERDWNDAECAEAMLAENLQRADLTPIEEGRAFAAWCEAHAKASKEERPNAPAALAARIGKGEDYVRERMRFLRLEPAAQAGIEQGTLPLKAARTLLRVQEPKQRKALLELALRGEVDGYEVTRIAEGVYRDLGCAPWRLEEGGRPCVGCASRRMRDGSEVLPPQKRGAPDLGVCAEAACWAQKEKAFWEGLGARLASCRPSGKSAVQVQQWKKGCPGCARQVVCAASWGEGDVHYEKWCEDSGAHFPPAKPDPKLEARVRKKRQAWENLRQKEKEAGERLGDQVGAALHGPGVRAALLLAIWGHGYRPEGLPGNAGADGFKAAAEWVRGREEGEAAGLLGRSLAACYGIGPPFAAAVRRLLGSKGETDGKTKGAARHEGDHAGGAGKAGKDAGKATRGRRSARAERKRGRRSARAKRKR